MTLLEHHPCLFAVALFFLIAPCAYGGEDSSYVRLLIRDNSGHERQITIGVHSAASRGFDQHLGEMPLPPFPPIEAFDARCLVPDARRLYAGDGSSMDIRSWSSAARTDTFRIRTQAGADGYPIRVTWDTTAVRPFTRSQLTVAGGGRAPSIDLHQRGVLSIEDREATMIVIELGGARRPTDDVRTQPRQGTERR